MFSMKTDYWLFEQMGEWMRRGENDKVKFVIKQTAPTDLVNKNKKTLLHLAAWHGNVEMMQYLERMGLKMDVKDSSDKTPLMLAIDGEEWEAAIFLLDRNVDIFAMDEEFVTPFDRLLLKEAPNPEVLKRFFTQVSRCPNRDASGILHLATEKFALDLMESLLDCGESPNAFDSIFETPIFRLDYELSGVPESKPKKAFQLLLMYGADIEQRGWGAQAFLDRCTMSKNIHKMVVAHLAILESDGVSLEECTRQSISELEQGHTYFESCCQQLQKMKMKKIHLSLTLFETLTESWENLIRRVRSLDEKVIKNYFRSSSVQEYEPYYISTSRWRFQKALKISNLRDKAVAVIGDSIEILKPYHLVIEKICGYLTFYDLREFA